MNQYQVRKSLLEKNNNLWDMNNYVQTGFTSQNVRNIIFDNGLDKINIVENQQTKKENISREQLIKQVYGKDESELSELELNGIEAFYQDQDRGESEFQQQAKNDYELQQNNQLFFILKRLKQGYDKGGIGFAAQKAKEIFIDKPLDYVVNNPVSKFVQDIYNFLISLIKNKSLFLIGLVAITIFIKKV